MAFTDMMAADHDPLPKDTKVAPIVTG